jgi:hypothetical protein
MLSYVSILSSRLSTNAENAVNELIEQLQTPLSSDELDRMLHPSDASHGEPDAYTGLLNYYTQKNTDAFIKCTSIDRKLTDAFIKVKVLNKL